MKKIIAAVLSFTLLLSSASMSFAANTTTSDKINTIKDTNATKVIEVTNSSGQTATASLDKKTGIMTIKDIDGTVTVIDTSIDMSKTVQSQPRQKLSSSADSINSSFSISSTSVWTCIDSNMDNWYSYYYAIWKNDDTYSWDIFDGHNMKYPWEDSSTASDLNSFASNVDSMRNNQVAFMTAITVTFTTSIASFIFGGGGLTQTAFAAGIAALGVYGSCQTYGYNISQNVRLADRYYARLPY